METQNLAIVIGNPSPDHAARKHHKFGPSKLPYTAECPGFTSTDGTSEAAEQGTRLHEIADELVKQWKATKQPLFELLDAYSKANPLDDDERGLLGFCFKELNKWINRTNIVENEIEIEVLDYSVPETDENRRLTAGFLDLLLIFGTTALLIDWKFGFIPVAPAPTNLQGRAYALGAFLKYPRLDKIGVMFVQPKLGGVTDTLYKRSDIPMMFSTIRDTVNAAMIVRRDPAGTVNLLKTGDYCAYCAKAKDGTCPAKMKQLSLVAAQRAEIPLPSLNVDSLDTPEKAALALYWVNLVEEAGFLDAIKTRAKEFALAAPGRSIEYFDAKSDTLIRYAIEERRHDRSIGSPLEVHEALGGIVTMEEILGCAELSLGKTEEVVSNAIYEQENDGPAKIVAATELSLAAEVAAGKLTKTAAAKKLSDVKKQHPRITKKDAKERFAHILEAHGALSRPDGKIPVLKRQKTAKQIQNAK
jgi:hypothetical protein